VRRLPEGLLSTRDQSRADDKAVIDQQLCDDCRDLFEPRCPRDCRYEAIGSIGADGGFEAVVADPIARYRPQNLVYLVVAMHPQGFDFYTKMPWPAILDLLSRFAADPKMEACVSTHLDDFCKTCEAKYSAKHLEGNVLQDARVHAAFGRRAMGCAAVARVGAADGARISRRTPSTRDDSEGMRV